MLETIPMEGLAIRFYRDRTVDDKIDPFQFTHPNLGCDVITSQPQTSTSERLWERVTMGIHPMRNRPLVFWQTHDELFEIDPIEQTTAQSPIDGGDGRLLTLIEHHSEECIGETDGNRGAAAGDIRPIPVQDDARHSRRTPPEVPVPL